MPSIMKESTDLQGNAHETYGFLANDVTSHTSTYTPNYNIKIRSIYRLFLCLIFLCVFGDYVKHILVIKHSAFYNSEIK